ncbi:hypothetical protein BV22DRAFT_1050642 [Leucogyrophana mollusca]|uniref:Uncharacterized protein n=1 Tax=Leucogyrophana mollusca TaxID=85980 RepID=A0ACB8B480_9AGAM|nr:hypothetical protein BV22DRAFT_1050642 [Leucogyrophana mollusca]
MSERPSRSTANKNPAKIVLDAAPKRRTSAQKKANDADAAARKAVLAENARKKYQKDVNDIAAAEDVLRQEDARYGTIPSASFSISSKKTNGPRSLVPDKPPAQKAQAQVHGNEDISEERIEESAPYESDGDDNDFKPNASEDEADTSDGSVDTNGSISDDEETQKRAAKKGKQKKQKKPKQRSTREAIDAARAIPAMASAQGKKRKEIDDNESTANTVNAKRTKSGQARNLESDWRKKIGIVAKNAKAKKSTHVSNDGDEPDLIPTIVDHSRSSSRTSMSRMTNASSDNPLVGGMFDDDEPTESLSAVRKAKSTGGKPQADLNRAHQGTSRTTGQMGVVLKKTDVDDAVAQAREHKRSGSKALKSLKAFDLPFTEDADHKIWDSFIRALLDWAGTTDDPFGTNEHPELAERLQELWDLFFAHLPLDISNHPAIKKLATDRLNDWRSQFGKNAIARLEKYFKDPTYRNDAEARAEYVQKQLPQVIDGQRRVPFLYADPVKSWLSPLLLDIFVWHVKRVGDAYQVFGRPSGALAMSAAAFQRALTLYKTGHSKKDEKDVKGRRKPGIDFDNIWGTAAQKYTKFTTSLPDSKWDSILDVVGAVNKSSRTITPPDEDSLDDGFDIPLSDEEEPEDVDEDDNSGDQMG